MILGSMARAIQRMRGWGAEPEVFIVGTAAIKDWDHEADQMLTYAVQTKARQHRELLGVPVVVSRGAKPDSVELVVRRPGCPPTVEPIR